MRSALAATVVLFIVLPARLLFGASTAADEQAGAALFRDQGCAHCHGPNGSGGKKGPDLSGLRNDRNWPPAKITNQILNGGQKMPPFSDALTDQQIAQLVAFLRARHKPAIPAVPDAAPIP